jgi:RHS repeat-associated protein
LPFVKTQDYNSDVIPLRTAANNTTEYIGPFVVCNGKLDKVLFNGGYVTFGNTDLSEQTYHYFSTDHQGNVRAVYDEAGNIEQSIAYDPFGVIIPDLSTGTDIQPYLYNGKELDRVHGLNWYDYGARMYDVTLGHWTTVDPLCEKYYNVSPYAYCGNNPVNRIDPDGKDEWELNRLGEIVRHIENNRQDAFYIINEKGERSKDKSIAFKYGTVKNFSTHENKGIAYDVYQMKGDNHSTQLFEFLAKNTIVEWSQTKTGIENSGTNFITSSHESHVDNGVMNLIDNQLKNGYTIRSINHSHPNNSPYPSGLDKNNGDISFSKWVTLVTHQNPQFGIYIPQSGQYVKYSPNSQNEDYGFTGKPIELEELKIILEK